MYIVLFNICGLSVVLSWRQNRRGLRSYLFSLLDVISLKYYTYSG